MSKSFDFRRARPWEVALTVFALSAPLLLPLATPGSGGFIRKAVAQEMQQVDSSKLVTIGGAITEIVYALGEEGRLVARDATSMYPEEALKLPDVGYMRALSPEGVIAVNPTAILAVEGSGPADALAVLKSAGIPFELVPEGYDRAAILKKIDVVGNFLGVPEKAKELEAKVGADLDTAIADAAKRPEASASAFSSSSASRTARSWLPATRRLPTALSALPARSMPRAAPSRATSRSPTKRSSMPSPTSSWS